MNNGLQAYPIYKRLWSCLLPHQQRTTIIIFIGMLLGTVLELVGIGMVLPIISIITQDQPLAQFPQVELILEIPKNISKLELIIVSMLFLLIAYTIRTLFLLFLLKQQTTFIFELQASISQRLYNGYLTLPYTFHISRNSAQLISNTISQVGRLAGAIQQSIMIVTEVLIISTFSFFLIIIEPVAFPLVACVLGAVALGFNWITKTRISYWGKALQGHETKRVQYLQEGLGAIKEIKLLNKENEFIRLFGIHNSLSAKYQSQQTTLAGMPRLVLELLSVSGLVCFIIVMILQNEQIDGLLPTIGVFGAAAFRLMPSINRILAGLQYVRFSMPVIYNLTQEMKSMELQHFDEPEVQIKLTNAIELKDINFKYEGAQVSTLKMINIRIEKGSAIGIVGSSGAGKSTLVDIMLGLLTPTNGAVYVDGVDINRFYHSWQKTIGYVPQHIFLTDDTLRKNIAFGVPDEEINASSLNDAIVAAQLTEFISKLPLGIDTFVGERGIRFSGGQRQRIGIARALYTNPQILVLDEATSALDKETEMAVMQAIAQIKGKKTIIAIAHRTSTLEQCDYIYKIEDGEVFESGLPSEMLN